MIMTLLNELEGYIKGQKDFFEHFNGYIECSNGLGNVLSRWLTTFNGQVNFSNRHLKTFNGKATLSNGQIKTFKTSKQGFRADSSKVTFKVAQNSSQQLDFGGSL